MRVMSYALGGLLATHLNVLADDCTDRFTQLVTDRSDKGPVKILAIQQVGDAAPTRNYNYQLTPGHWMTEMIEPDTMPWSLTFDGTMFMSTDKGTSWTKVRDLTVAEQAQAGAAPSEDIASTVANVACGREDLEGTPHERVEGEYTLYGGRHRQVFWLAPDGWITKSDIRSDYQGTIMTVTQHIAKAPGLTLPQPE